MPLTPEQIAGVRETLALSAEVPDGEVEKVDGYFARIQQDRERERAEWAAERQELEAENARLEERAVALSADAPRRHSPEDVADYLESVADWRERLIKGDKLTDARAKHVDALILSAGGDPEPLFLSAHGAGQERRRLGIAVYRMLDKVLPAGASRRGEVPEPAAVASLRLDGGDGQQKPDPNRIRELKEQAGLPTK